MARTRKMFFRHERPAVQIAASRGSRRDGDAAGAP